MVETVLWDLLVYIIFPKSLTVHGLSNVGAQWSLRFRRWRRSLKTQVRTEQAGRTGGSCSGPGRRPPCSLSSGSGCPLGGGVRRFGARQGRGSGGREWRGEALPLPSAPSCASPRRSDPRPLPRPSALRLVSYPLRAVHLSSFVLGLRGGSFSSPRLASFLAPSFRTAGFIRRPRRALRVLGPRTSDRAPQGRLALLRSPREGQWTRRRRDRRGQGSLLRAREEGEVDRPLRVEPLLHVSEDRVWQVRQEEHLWVANRKESKREKKGQSAEKEKGMEIGETAGFGIRRAPLKPTSNAATLGRWESSGCNRGTALASRIPFLSARSSDADGAPNAVERAARSLGSARPWSLGRTSRLPSPLGIFSVSFGSWAFVRGEERGRVTTKTAHGPPLRRLASGRARDPLSAASRVWAEGRRRLLPWALPPSLPPARRAAGTAPAPTSSNGSQPGSSGEAKGLWKGT